MRTRAAIGFVAFILLASSCGRGTARPQGSASTPPPTHPSRSPTPSGPTPADARYVIGPGAFVTSTFRPRFTFTLRQEWWVDGEDPTSMLMVPGISYQSEENLIFLDVQRVFEPSNQRKAVKAPKDLIGWFLHHPGLKFLTKPRQVVVGGIKGTEFDVELGKKAPLCEPNPNLPPGTRCWLISPFSPGNPFSPQESAVGPPFGIFTSNRGAPDRNRIDILSVHGHHLMIGYADYPDSFPRTIRLFEQLLQTIRFG